MGTRRWFSLIGAVAVAIQVMSGAACWARTEALPDFPPVANRFQTQEQQDADILEYEIDLAFNTLSHVVEGSVTVTCTSLAESLSVLVLDAAESFVIESVTTVSGEPLTWVYGQERIEIAFDPVLKRGEERSVVLNYRVTSPPTVIFPSVNNLYTFSDPWFARTWWPCKDYPDDKALFTIKLSVPENMNALSNGKSLGYTEVTRWGSPYRQYAWQVSYPMTTFNFFVVAGTYELVEAFWEYAPGDTMQIANYSYYDNVSSSELNIEMLEFFSSLFGQYPFVDDKYGVVPWLLDGASMEHQTLSCLSVDHINDRIALSHELLHQWFGNGITIKDWRDIWLAEGFAEYGEVLWFEHEMGLINFFTTALCDFYGIGTVLREDDSSDAMYYFDHCSVYAKGAYILHMLRRLFGDEAFFEMMRGYVDEYMYGVAETEDFIRVCEEYYGASLEWFFTPWLNYVDIPSYEWNWFISDKSELTILVEQVADRYTMPVRFRIETATAARDTILWVEDVTEAFTLPVSGMITSVVLDPDDDIFCHKQEVETGIADAGPLVFPTLSNYPNPFNAATTLSFMLPDDGHAELAIYSVSGQTVRMLVSDELTAGTHTLLWDGCDNSGMPVSSGVYFSQLIAGNAVLIDRMMLVK